MTFLHLFAASLATFRLALMISSEQGPFRVFAKVRQLPPLKSNARDGLSCEWCMSVWVSAFVSAFLCWSGRIHASDWPFWWLAISGGAVALNQLLIAPKK